MEQFPISGSNYITEADLTEQFVRASGPGGQNVNKVSTAVLLRFDLKNCETLSSYIKTKAAELAGSRLTKSGEILIQAERFRTQDLNREDARNRLLRLLKQASERPKLRKPTRPTLASKKRRLEKKTQRGSTKQNRKKPNLD
ncbi:MAG: alternative ribosome rescue aminoacyl-tRNA hydrolase ArfB [Hyphomicrobiales bacterium]